MGKTKHISYGNDKTWSVINWIDYHHQLALATIRIRAIVSNVNHVVKLNKRTMNNIQHSQSFERLDNWQANQLEHFKCLQL